MTFVAGGALKPIGGHILSHSSATRMFLRKGMYVKIVEGKQKWTIYIGRAEERVAKLVDSPDRPESEASYKLDEGGWTDVWNFHPLASGRVPFISASCFTLLGLDHYNHRYSHIPESDSHGISFFCSDPKVLLYVSLTMEVLEYFSMKPAQWV